MFLYKEIVPESSAIYSVLAAFCLDFVYCSQPRVFYQREPTVGPGMFVCIKVCEYFVPYGRKRAVTDTGSCCKA